MRTGGVAVMPSRILVSVHGHDRNGNVAIDKNLLANFPCENEHDLNLLEWWSVIAVVGKARPVPIDECPSDSSSWGSGVA